MLLSFNLWIADTFTRDALWPWVFVAVPLWAVAIYVRLYNPVKSVPMDVMVLRKKYLSLQPPIHKSQEKLLPICEMYVYPVRGIRAE